MEAATKCKVCRSPFRELVDAALAVGHRPGRIERHIWKRWRTVLGRDAISRHEFRAHTQPKESHA